MLEGLGIKTGIDLDALIDVGSFITEALGKSTHSSVGAALSGKRSKAKKSLI